jgi:type IV pilus biogenesis protein CpaD/CtpE
MKARHLPKYVLTVILAFSLAGCLTQRTVTQGGRTVKQEYIMKRPLKDALQNSQ